MPRITSADNPRVKHATRLVASSRERAKSGRCVLEGEHLLRVFRERHGAPETVIVVESALEKPGIRKLAEIKLMKEDPESVEKLSDEIKTRYAQIFKV